MGSTEEILGYHLRNDDVQSCVNEIGASILRGDRRRWLACMNPHSYAVSRRRPSFGLALAAADWLVPDGVGMLIASRWLKRRIRQRITGSDIFAGVNLKLDRSGGASVFFLGSTAETLQRIRERFEKEYRDIKVVGTYSPPYRSTFSGADVDEMIQEINAARPDVLWVGMTAPKQEEFIYAAIDRLDVKFAAGIGAVFDFYGGCAKRSNAIFISCGLEWLGRLLQQPRRLWRRTLVSAPVFLWLVFLDGLVARRRLG